MKKISLLVVGTQRISGEKNAMTGILNKSKPVLGWAEVLRPRFLRWDDLEHSKAEVDPGDGI